MTDGGMANNHRGPAADPGVGAGPVAAPRHSLDHGRRLLGRGWATLVRLFDQRGKANKGLTVGLGILVGGACVLGVSELIAVFPAGIDLEIPLRAASHWASGSQAYPPSAMLVQSGPDLPYLYPPFLLPFLAPIAALPRDTVTGVWLILCFMCAVWTCRRLAIPWLAVPFVLAWPPFAEGLITGNVQIISFAAFVALLYEPVDGALRQRTFLPQRDALNGVLAGAVGVLKTTQLLPVLYLARRRFRAAFLGVAVLGTVALATLLLTGLDIYGDWLSQLQRAADPAWTIGGVALGHRVGIPDSIPIAIGIVLALVVRGKDSAAWLGIALIVATPSVHGYTFLFLLPGLLTIRRDVAIPVAALFIGVYHGFAWWMAFVFVVYFLVAMIRWPRLRAVGAEPADPAARQSANPCGERPGLT
jgi:Glycosyltransferase family 87